MTNRRQAARVRAIRWMKGLLLTGSVAASVLGTQLLAEKDASGTLPAVVLPAQAQRELRWQQTPTGETLQMAPIPTAAARLRPVARSRSSR